VDYDYSPAVWQKVIYAATQAGSFEQAARDLSKLAELNVSDQRVRRAALHIGDERVMLRDAEAAAYEALSLPARRTSPVDQVPQVACVQMDGGRLQIRARGGAAARSASDGHWREMKAGCCLSMVSEVLAEDPCPQLPETFVDPERMSQIAGEIKGFSADSAADESPPPQSQPPPDEESQERRGRPQPLARSVIATRRSVEEFGPLLAAAAWSRGFAAALRKAFVADGSETNWGVWRKYFSDYVPILDFIHALCYVYAAALAGRAAAEGFRIYQTWAQWLWSGKVDLIIAALQERQQELGGPAEDESATAPRVQVAKTLGYLQNQRQRMQYDEYRRQGLPITSSYVESTVKQLNRRMKGTEKFWSEGAEPMLTLVADHLSDTPVLHRFWRDRHARLTGLRCYQHAA
jgi:hypothetical protein